jgi:hypothetical protein
VIGQPKPDEGAEEAEPELAEASVGRKPIRDSLSAVSDGHRDAFAPTESEPIAEEEEYAEPDLDEELVGAVDDLDIPNIVVDEPEVAEAPVMMQEEEEPEPEEEPLEPFFDDELEEEEEEEDWSVGRGRKKAKPRSQRQPPKRQEKRRRY